MTEAQIITLLNSHKERWRKYHEQSCWGYDKVKAQWAVGAITALNEVLYAIKRDVRQKRKYLSEDYSAQESLSPGQRDTPLGKQPDS